jgi:glucose-1-phosphate thymidylyltransferase
MHLHAAQERLVKAVVLARGKGTRMRAVFEHDKAAMSAAQRRAADAGLKAMIPFRRPFLDYVLSALADAGCDDVCLVVGPEHEEIQEYYTRRSPPSRVRVSFAIQPRPLGTADAVVAAEAFASGQPFLTLNADTYYPAGIFRSLVALGEPGLPAFSRDALVSKSNIDAGRIQSYALLRIDLEGYLEDIVEKPDHETYQSMTAGGALISMNVWRFDASIFDACRRVGPSPRGELELPNAVRHAVRDLGHRYRTFRAEEGVLDLSHRSDIPAVEQRLSAVDPQP